MAGRSAWGRFAGSWGIALRMARRDVRRHKGRSALIMIMVAVPTALLTLALTVSATSQVAGAELIPGRMGNGVAQLDYPVPNAIQQPFDPSIGIVHGDSPSDKVTPIPGWVDGGSPFDNAQAMSTLTGTRAVPYLEESVTTRRSERRVNLQALAIDVRSGITGKFTLLTGRAPERFGEILVTERGAEGGLPTTGSMTVRSGDGDVDVDVVGTVRVLADSGMPANDLVTPAPFAPRQARGGWILLDNEAITWRDITALNRHGVIVWSADVLRNPPADSELSPAVRGMTDYNRSESNMLLSIGGALLLVVTTLLVGPAFAVSAARQRRTLALSASNGATTGQLRHSVLAQAVVLGVLSAIVGSALGVLLAWLGSRGSLLLDFLAVSGPFDVPWIPLLLVTGAAIASTVVAALLPARRLGRLDIIGVMKGQSVSPPASKIVFLVGLVVAIIGGLVLLSLARIGAEGRTGTEFKVAVSTIALVVGAIMLSPVVLVAIARVSSHLPVALRMATRDAGRQRGRSVPAVAAILAGVAALTMSLISSQSDEEQNRREYTAQNLIGDATAMGTPEQFDIDDITAPLRSVRPSLEFAAVSTVDMADPYMYSSSPNPPSEPYDTKAVNVVPPGCTPQQAVFDKDYDPTPTSPSPPCQIIGTHGLGNAQMTFTSVDEIARRLRALGRDQDVAAVRRGAVVVGRAPGRPSLLSDGKVTVMTGTVRVDPRATEMTDPLANLSNVRTVKIPAVEVELNRSTIGALLGSSMLAAPELAAAQGWPTLTSKVTIHDPAGPITEDLVERLGFVTDDDVWIATERGFVSDSAKLVLALIGIMTLLLLVITLTSTALTLAEQENDQATLAALGSGRGTRRIMAAAQAFVLCLIGVALGIAVGIVPGIALAYPLTAQSYDPITGNSINGDPILVIPWLILLGFAIAVPAISAGLAAAGIRKAPDATHRTA